MNDIAKGIVQAEIVTTLIGLGVIVVILGVAFLVLMIREWIDDRRKRD